MNLSFSSEAARSEVWCCECKYKLNVSQSLKNRAITRPRESHLHQYDSAECRAHFRLQHEKTGTSCDLYHFF